MVDHTDQPKWLGSHQRSRSLAFLVLVLPVLLLLLSLLWLCLCFQCWHPLLQNRRAHLLPFYAKALIANCKTVWRVFALVMSRCAYLNGSVFLVKTRYFLHDNCAKSRELCVVFWKKCALELQFGCRSRNCACSLAELVQGVGEWVTCCGHCVSSTRICV